MFIARRRRIDPCCLNTGMAQDLGQPEQIFPGPVEGKREQVPEIVGEYLLLIDAGFPAKFFQLTPDDAAVNGLLPV